MNMWVETFVTQVFVNLLNFPIVHLRTEVFTPAYEKLNYEILAR